MRRWLLRIFVFLLLGAIVNVAVAWGCGLFAYRNSFINNARDHPPTPEEVTWWRANTPTQDGDPFSAAVTDVRGYTEMQFIGTGRGSKPANSHVNTMALSAYWSESGWPTRSLRAVWFDIPDATVRQWTLERRGAIEIDAPWLNEKFPDRSSIIPLKPLWPGFAVNTAFYAAILWLLFVGPFALRRRRRMRRGLCPKCAYDLRGTESDACPECDAPSIRSATDPVVSTG